MAGVSSGRWKLWRHLEGTSFFKKINKPPFLAEVSNLLGFLTSSRRNWLSGKKESINNDSRAVLTFIFKKQQGWFSRSLEVLFWYSHPSKIYRFIIKLSIQRVYTKHIHGLSPEKMNEFFSTRANIYNIRQSNVFKTHIPTLNRYGLNSIPYKTPSGIYFLKTSNNLSHSKAKSNCGSALIVYVT